MKPAIQHILWDWHGVLGVERLWQRPTQHIAQVMEFQQQAFSDPLRVDAWMRGDVTSQQLLDRFALSLTRKQLADQIYAGWPGRAWINIPLHSGLTAILPQCLHSIVTDNVDVFSDYLAEDSWVRANFTCYVNSAEHGRLKGDNESLLFIAEQQSGISLQRTLLIDDSPSNCVRMRELGGQAAEIARWPRV